MVPYVSKTGKKKGVKSYQIEADTIILNYESENGEIRSILYSHAISGVKHVENLKRFALAAAKLNRYLTQNKIRYKKWNSTAIEQQQL